MIFVHIYPLLFVCAIGCSATVATNRLDESVLIAKITSSEPIRLSRSAVDEGLNRFKVIKKNPFRQWFVPVVYPVKKVPVPAKLFGMTRLPIVLEFFLQRIQSYFSHYVYEDLSRPPTYDKPSSYIQPGSIYWNPDGPSPEHIIYNPSATILVYVQPPNSSAQNIISPIIVFANQTDFSEMLNIKSSESTTIVQEATTESIESTENFDEITSTTTESTDEEEPFVTWSSIST